MTLTFHLPDLPTAQHKAGLAGLVLQVRELQERADDFAAEELPVLEEVSPLRARFTLTERSTRQLFDELYSARVEEVTVKSKWQGQTPKRIEKKQEADPESGKPKTVTYFTYDVVTPRNPFLMRHLDEELWQKLWRDMLFNIPRAKPTTRIPYNERAAGKHCSEGGKVWKELQQFEKARRKNEIRTTSVSGALLLGAQDVSAENVPFQDRSDHALLLHFWPLTALVFVPWLIKVDAADPAASKEEPVGYALAIPEVSDLEEFCEAFPEMLAALAHGAQKKGYRPRDACIDLPEQSALEFMEHFAGLTGAMIAEKRQALRRRINSVEYRHLIKAGNNVKSLSGGRVVADPDLLDRYERIRGGYRNPVFRATLLRALLRSPPDEYERHWFRPFEEPLRTMPREFFVRGGETPPPMRSFPADAAARFRAVHDAHRSRSEAARMEKQSAPLEDLILQMARNFLRQKAGEKAGVAWESFKDKRVPIEGQEGRTRIDVPPEFREAHEQIATDTFLAIRSRRGRDFAGYFTARICAASQRHLNDKDDFRVLSQALLEKPDDVKTLTLLALSACS
ncbi:MAG TPA: type I-MYXAN CRISPR-associated protein Cmx8 [Planctomycetaceae bacterium]